MTPIKNHLSPEFSRALIIRAENFLGVDPKTLRNLITSSRNNNIKIFTDNYGRLAGYVSWSRISSDTLRMMYKSLNNPRYIYERNDGKIFLIDDIVFGKAYQKTCKRKLRKFLYKKRCFCFIKSNKLKLYVRNKKRFKSTTI